ncbi:MAG: HD domain-containing phosphohydrolase [Thermodesulfobacteriota bacterium]|nr:HD domain-containing phosphohydrolase [Thermodesulfobacteriota bacterium]
MKIRGNIFGKGVDFFKDKISMIRNHHEHFDGRGYPDGLVGEVIPLEARIIAVADAFDAMTSLRPHRRALPVEDVLFEMEKGKGKQFDPNILEIFLMEKIYDGFVKSRHSGENRSPEN